MVNTLSPQRNFRELANYILLISLIGMGVVVFYTLTQFALPRPQFVSLGPITQFQFEQPVYLALRQNGQTFFVWVVNLEGNLRVLDARTTHPIARDWNCIVVWIDKPSPWSPKQDYFTDPCIGGAWNLDGSYQWGPAPRALDWHPAEIGNRELWIDIIHIQKGESWINQ